MIYGAGDPGRSHRGRLLPRELGYGEFIQRVLGGFGKVGGMGSGGGG